MTELRWIQKLHSIAQAGLTYTQNPFDRERYHQIQELAAEMLADDLEAMGPIRVSEVEAAQKEILSIARRLADAGEIMLGAGGGEEFL
jgi:flagellar motor switch protein FliG